jgi:hypothetical protein
LFVIRFDDTFQAFAERVGTAGTLLATAGKHGRMNVSCYASRPCSRI